MPIATRTFRVFVSSTFEDLKAERDALQRDVFPKLRSLCERHGARFQAIDLRWGVRDEAALDQQTVEICLREIRRCQATGVRPNFIVLLGDRYGWQPLPTLVPAVEFDALLPYLPPLATQWYWLDENAVPPEYCLQPRTGEFVAPAVWTPVEQTLREFLAAAARSAGLGEQDLIKYEASATHQEILAGLGETEEDSQHVFAFVRPSTSTTDPRVEKVKSHLRVQDFDAVAVYDQLRQVIEAEIKRFQDRPALDLEVEAHDRFAEERCRIFTGRQAVLDTISEYIRGPERRPLVLHGESGSGKSAVMAKASQQYPGPGRLIRRFIGVSLESASGHALLTSLCKQIEPGETPVDYGKLEDAFQERLKGELILFIDAVDQLAANDPARLLHWLRQELPPGVKVIVSTTDEVTGLAVQLERMTQPEGGQALDAMLREAGRTLRWWQRDKVLAHFARCGLPLYLRLAAEESKLWKSYTPPDPCKLGEGTAGVIDTLFARLASNANHGAVLVERSLGYLAAARYGLTEDEVLDVLTADDTVWKDFDQRKHHEVSQRRLPAVVWSRLSLDLEPYLTERTAPGGTVITFYHRQLAERSGVGLNAELACYFLGRPVSDARRLVELPFQQREAHQWREAEATLFNCPFLFAKVTAGMVMDLDDDYQGLLQEAPASALPRREALRLIHGALRLSGHVVTQDSSQLAPQTVGRLLAHRDNSDIAMFVDEITATAPRPWFRPLHPCLDPPGGALLLVLEGHSEAVTGVAVTPDGKRAVSASYDKTMMVWDLDTGRLLRTLEGHSWTVSAAAVMPDGRRAVSASWDTTLKVWDLNTGRVLRTLDGHSYAVYGVAVTPDGERAVSAAADCIKVWDLETGRALRTLQGHSGIVNGVAVTPDGRRAVSASDDKTLKVWDLDTGNALGTLEGHSGPVLGVAVTPDGNRSVSASGEMMNDTVSGFGTLTRDNSIKVWDLDTGLALRTLEGHSGPVSGVALTADGKRAVSASHDGTMKVWDLDTGFTLCTLEGIGPVAVTPDGKRAVSASEDCTLKVWDLETNRSMRTPQGHSDSVDGVVVTADGKRAVSASHDGTMKVWDLDTGHTLLTLEGHTGPVSGVAVTPDCKRAISASNDWTLKVWDLDTGRALLSLQGHSGCVSGIAVTPNGKQAVSASWMPPAKVWELNTVRAPLSLDGHSGRVSGTAVTPDGKRAVWASRMPPAKVPLAPVRSMVKTLILWDLETGSALHTREGDADFIEDLKVTPDGKHAVTACRDNTLKLWDLETLQVMRKLEGHSETVTAVALTQDGKRIVSASWDKTLILWDLETGHALRTMRGHLQWVYDVAVTADGKRAVSASWDRTLKAWNLDTGLPVATFQFETRLNCAACAAPNLIVAGDEGGRVYFLALEE